MGRDMNMIALDSNAMTYWIDALSSVPGPPAEPNSVAKLALARIFFWMPQDSCFHYVPTVEAEYRAIKDRAKRDNHLSWAMVLISPVRPLPDITEVDRRAAELMRFHECEKDCRIVAECELTEILTLITCDSRFLKRLKTKTRIRLCIPSEYWDLMAVPKGTRPKQVPHETNPLSKCTWWHWPLTR
jgi:hypothetical protein